MSAWPSWDIQLFQLLNGQLHAPLLDRVMPVFTSAQFLGPLVLLLLVVVVRRHGRAGVRVALVAFLALGLSDLVTSQLLKPAIHRPRPCRQESALRLLVRCGGRNGFPSNHAANAAALAGALAFSYPASLRATGPLALAVAWSRIYVGVHYPLDVAAGLLFGGGVGWSVAALASGFRPRRRGPAAAEPEGGPIAETRDLR